MFSGCSSLETITNLQIPQTVGNVTMSSLSSSEFDGCAKLDLSFIDFSEITYLGGSCLKGCSVPENLILNKCTVHESYCLQNSSARRIYLPILTNPQGGYRFVHAPYTLIDFGSNINGTFSQWGGYNGKTVVFRGTDHSNMTLVETDMPSYSKIYVSSATMAAFVQQFPFAESKTYAIGGTEWTTQFGSSDEWADYPNGVNPYANASS